LGVTRKLSLCAFFVPLPDILSRQIIQWKSHTLNKLLTDVKVHQNLV
jgi:hypothetical protein